jgi:protein O-GlcNAc transferase
MERPNSPFPGQAMTLIQNKLQQGLALRQRGKPFEAEQIFEEVLRLDSKNVRSTYYLGLLALESRRASRGAELFRRAIELDPTSEAAHFNLGNCLSEMGRLNDAFASYEKAIALNPRYPEAYHARGTILYRLGQYEAAVASFDKAAALKPDFVVTHNNRGIALFAMKRFQDALLSFNQAIKLNRDYADAYCNRAGVLIELGRLEEALASSDKAIALNPKFALAHNIRGVALKELNRLDEAVASFDNAIALNPANAVAFYNKGNTLRESGQQSEAADSYVRAVALAPDYIEAKIALCMAQLPILYREEAEIAKCRAAYRRHIEDLSAYVDRQKSGSDLTAAIGASQPFFLAYQGLNDRELQEIYGSLVCRTVAKKYPPSVSSSRLPKSGEPIRLAIISGFFRRHSNWKIPIKGWLTQIDREKFQVFGYHTSANQDAETKQASALCNRFVQGPMSIDDWRKIILNDAPDVIIYPEVGMDPVSRQLAAQRLASVQCSSWGHPDTSGMPTLDYFLSSDLMEPPDAADHYSEKLIRLPNLSIYYDPIDTESVAVERGALGLREGAAVYWCGQSLYKYLPQHDDVFPKIANLAGDCQFVFLRHPSARAVTELFQKRLEIVFANHGMRASDHCLFLDRLTAGQFVGAMAQCDVFLDSIDWSGCNSTLESLACDLPIVTMKGALMRGRHSSAILQMMGLDETIADSVDGYISLAAKLGVDREARRESSLKIAERKQAVYRDRACISALEQFLENAVRALS